MKDKLNHIDGVEKEPYIISLNMTDYYHDDMTDEEIKEIDEIFNDLKKYEIKNEK